MKQLFNYTVLRWKAFIVFAIPHTTSCTVNISSPATDEGKEISHSNEVVYCCGIEESLQKRWNYFTESNKIKKVSLFYSFNQIS